MTLEDEDRVRLLVEELDRLIPRAGAAVLLRQYGGGPDECEFIANQTGFLCFGVELLKAGVAPYRPHATGPQTIPTGLKDLVLDDSTVGFDQVLRDDNLPRPAQPESVRSMAGRAGLAGCMLSCIIVLLIGLVTTIRWVWRTISHPM